MSSKMKTYFKKSDISYETTFFQNNILNLLTQMLLKYTLTQIKSEKSTLNTLNHQKTKTMQTKITIR
jgi:hypothetical protein